MKLPHDSETAAQLREQRDPAERYRPLPWFVVMSIQIGAEGTFGPAAAAIGNGLLKNYKMKPDDVRFFTVHSEADEDHSSLAEEIAVRYLHAKELWPRR